MLKNIDPSNKSIKPFKAHKSFTLTNNDSGSGHFVLKAVSGSTYNFITGSASSQSFGSYVPSASAFEYGTFYDLPTDLVKLLDIRCKDHDNAEGTYRTIPRMLYEPKTEDTDGI